MLLECFKINKKLIEKKFIYIGLAAFLIINILIFLNPSTFRGAENIEGIYIPYVLFNVIEIFSSLLCGIFLIYILGVEYEENIFELMLSKCGKKYNFIIVQRVIMYVLTMIFLEGILFLNLYRSYLICAKNENKTILLNIGQTYFESITVVLFIISLSLFLISLVKDQIVSYVLIFAYLIVGETFSKGRLLKQNSLLININGSVNNNINKFTYLILTVILTIFFIKFVSENNSKLSDFIKKLY